MSIRIVEDSKDVCVVIQDTGKGIPSADLDKVFNSFVAEVPF